MKTVRTKAIGFLLFGALSLGGIPAGEAADYLGQLCWQATSAGGGGLIKAAITHMGMGTIS